jgi:release factor glutamine methyltransferase
METTQAVKSRAQLLRFLKTKLIASGIEEAEEEAQRILEEVLGVTKTEFYIDPENEVPQEAEKRSLGILAGREKRVPLAYLLGKADFWRETLFVNENCLIPRPETEFLIEAVIKNFPDKKQAVSFLDVGTGPERSP